MRTPSCSSATGDPDGRYRTIAVSVPQGTLITSISLNPTNDTLNSLRKVEIFVTLALLVAMGALVMVVVRRGGLRPPAPDGRYGGRDRLGRPDPARARSGAPAPRWAGWARR